MSYFKHGNCQLHYEEHGQGEPLLLVHGLGSSILDWEYQIPVLAARYRVITVDLRGHGRSDKPQGAYAMTQFAEDLAALVRHLQLSQVHLVGLSLGGMVGFQLAVDRPELLHSLTIVNSAPEVKIRDLRSAIELGKRWLFSRLFSLEQIARTLAPRMFPKPGQSELRRKVEERWPQNDKRAYLASLDAIIGWGVRERINRIFCPTLVISGDQDYTPVAYKAAYVQAMPNAQLVVIEDSFHVSPMDQPEHFNSILLNFLDNLNRKGH